MFLNLKVLALKDCLAPVCMVEALEFERVNDLFHPEIDGQPTHVLLVAVPALVPQLFGAVKAEQGVDALRTLDWVLVGAEHRVANTTLDQTYQVLGFLSYCFLVEGSSGVLGKI